MEKDLLKVKVYFKDENRSPVAVWVGWQFKSTPIYEMIKNNNSGLSKEEIYEFNSMIQGKVIYDSRKTKCEETGLRKTLDELVDIINNMKFKGEIKNE